MPVQQVERPSTCTRRRMKPYIDSCECEWCQQLDKQIEEAMRNRDQSVPILVRKGNGTYFDDSTDFSDTVDRIRRVPRQHSGWQSVVYNKKRYRLGGGIRTPYFICTNNPIPARK